MVSDHDRRQLHSALEGRLGEGPAGTLMDLLPPVGWADVARRSDITVLAAELRGEIAELRGEVGGIKGEIGGIRGEIAELRGEVTAEIGGIRGEIAELRGEVTAEIGGVKGELARLNARIDAQVPKLMWANVASMFGIAGLVLAAAWLA